MATYDSNGKLVKENYDGTGMLPNALRAVGAKFKSWGREAQGMPPAEPIIDLSAQNAAFNAWDDRMRNGTPTTVVAPAQAAVAPPVIAPRAALAVKPVVVPVNKGVRKVAAPRPASPTAITDGPPVVAQAPMTEQVQGTGGWLTQANNGGFAESDGTRIYAEKATPEAIAAAAVPVQSVERDTTYDPGTQGTWARNEGARQLLEATRGARGLVALGAYDTAQNAPGIAANTAQATLQKQLLENRGKIAETDLKGRYDINGNLIKAKADTDVASITGEYGLGRERIAGASKEKVANIAGNYDINGKLIEAGSRQSVAKLTGGNSDKVAANTIYTTRMAGHEAERKRILEDPTLMGKDKDGTKTARRKELLDKLAADVAVTNALIN